MKKILSLVLLLALLCAGCAEQAATETTEAPVETTAATVSAAKPVYYVLYAMGPEDDLLEADIMQDELVKMGFGYDEMFFEFYEDGTGHMNFMGVQSDILHDGTAYWLPDQPENRTPYTIEGNVMTIDNNGYLYILEH